jgi:methylamine dehydrogenase accessory protein MauD
MDGIWLVSYFALWMVVTLLLLSILVLARQVGLINRRLPAARARMENAGPKIGEQAPEVESVDLYGREVTLGSKRGKQTLLVFISAACASCDELAPAIRSISKSERENLEVLLVSVGGDESANRSFVARHKLREIPYVVSQNLNLLYNVAAPPYAILIDEYRVVLAKGVVNHLEHLESLINAGESGFPSMESWALAKGARRAETSQTFRITSGPS